ncbi:MAG: O-antigen ligase family protein [Armatimonadota bacterium]
MRHRSVRWYRPWTPERISALTRDVAIVIFGGIVLGLFAAAASAYYVVMAMAVVAIVSLILWQFEIVLIIYSLAAFVPWGRTPDIAMGGSGLGKGLYVSQVMLGLLLAIWFVKYLLLTLPGNRIRSGFHVPIALYLGYSVLNVVHSYIFWDAHVNRMYQYPHVNAAELGLRFLSAGAFVMMATTVSSRKWLKWTTVALCVPGIYNLFKTLLGLPIPVTAPWWPLVALLPVCYCYALALDSRSSWLVRIGGGLVTAAAIYMTLIRGIGWVSGWLALLAGLGAVTLLKSRRGFAVLVTVLVIGVAAAWPFFYEKVIIESQTQGDYDRFALLKGSWKYATTFPLGVGLGNYRSYNSFHYGRVWGTTTYTSAHSTYAQHLSEMGIPGLVLLLAILFSGGAWLASSFRRAEPGMTRTYLLAAFGQLVGISCAAFIGDYIIPTYHNGGLTTFSSTVYSWLIWGLAVAHVRLANGSISIDSQLEHTRSA